MLSLPYRSARPIVALKDTSLAKGWLAFDQIDSKLGETPLASEAELEPWAWNGLVGLSDHAKWLHKKSGLPVVAEVFRCPVPLTIPADGETVTAWAKSFRSSVGAAIHAEDGIISIRHPAYWLLRTGEPSEAVFRQVENASKVGKLTLADAVALACNDVTFHSFRFARPERLLMSADPTDIANAHLLLWCLGQLTKPEWQQLLTGQRVGARYWKKGSRSGASNICLLAYHGAPLYRVKANEAILGLIESQWYDNAAWLYLSTLSTRLSSLADDYATEGDPKGERLAEFRRAYPEWQGSVTGLGSIRRLGVDVSRWELQRVPYTIEMWLTPGKSTDELELYVGRATGSFSFSIRLGDQKGR